MNKFNKICSDIKSVKIQGATNIAKAAIKAYELKPTKTSIKKLSSLRPTEPLLMNALHFFQKIGKEKTLKHFDESQQKINKNVLKLIKKNKVIFTHCHSTNVVKSLLYAKSKGKKFQVYNTETRPLFQGRKTAKTLAKNKIKVTTFVDSGAHEAITKSDIIFLGADAILKSGVINKIGSVGISEIAYLHKKPVYIIADSWKFYPKKIKIEERDFHEVWKRIPKSSHIKIRNPAFAKIPKKYIKAIVSEYGTLKYERFLKRADKTL